MLWFFCQKFIPFSARLVACSLLRAREKERGTRNPSFLPSILTSFCGYHSGRLMPSPKPTFPATFPRSFLAWQRTTNLPFPKYRMLLCFFLPSSPPLSPFNLRFCLTYSFEEIRDIPLPGPKPPPKTDQASFLVFLRPIHFRYPFVLRIGGKTFFPPPFQERREGEGLIPYTRRRRKRLEF